MNLEIKTHDAIIDKPIEILINKINKNYEVEIPNISISLIEKENKFFIFDINCSYKKYLNKYIIVFESNHINKKLWDSKFYKNDKNNKYHIELNNKPYCIYNIKSNTWTLYLSFNIDESKETFEIWRVQNFHNIDFIFKKIYVPNYKFKNSNFLVYENAALEAEKYIDLFAKYYDSTYVAPYFDKIYIIKNGFDIKKYNGPEYYDMKNLYYRYHELETENNIKNIIFFIFMMIPLYLLLIKMKNIIDN